jgi:hypothetical protein
MAAKTRPASPLNKFDDQIAADLRRDRLRKTHLLEQVIRGVLKEVGSDDPLTQLALLGEVGENSELLHAAQSLQELLHAAQSYQSLQDYLLHCMKDNPGHEHCVAIQLGFQLGRRFAEAEVQR